MSQIPRLSTRATRAVLLGLPGVMILPFILPVPEGVPLAAVLANPMLLLILAGLAGAWAAPKAGLCSAVILGSAFRPRMLVAWTSAGIAMGAAVASIDHAAAPLWQTGNIPSLREGREAADLALGLLYGGLTEEILLRWGLASLLAVGLMQLLSPRSAHWLAAILAAFAFALAHLPAVAMEAGGITPGLLARTLIWNGALGLAYGAAFLRHGLEAAILAHMGTHLGFALAAF